MPWLLASWLANWLASLASPRRTRRLPAILVRVTSWYELDLRWSLVGTYTR